MAEKGCKQERSVFRGLGRQAWRLAEEFVALFALYSLVVRIINRSYLFFSGEYKTMTLSQVVAAEPVTAAGITVILPDPVVEILIGCIVVGTITYVTLKYVCREEWVQEPVQVKECWEEVQWYNPFSWFTAIVCTFVEVLKWVLKQICEWVEEIVIGLVIICIVVTAIIVFA